MTQLNISLPPRDPGPLSRILRAIGNELRKCEVELANLPQMEDYFGYSENVSFAVDGFLGAALVSCQAYISGTISMAGALQHRDGAQARLKKFELLRMHNPFLQGGRFSRVQAIDAFANYFKHRDEWDPNWLELKAKDQRTADIVRALGGSPEASDNMVRGAKALGLGDYECLEKVAFDLADWAYEVLDELRIRMNKAHRPTAG